MKKIENSQGLNYLNFGYIFFLLLCVMLFSRLGPLYIAPFTGGVYLPEIFLIPVFGLLIFGKHSVAKAVANCIFSSYSKFLFGALFFLAVIGALVNGDPKSSFAELRCIWILGIALLFFYKYSAKNPNIIRFIYILSFWVLVIDALLTIFIKFNILGFSGGADVDRISFSPYLILVPAYLSIRTHRFFEFFFAISLGALSCFIGGFRSGTLTSILCLAFIAFVFFDAAKQRISVRNLKIIGRCLVMLIIFIGIGLYLYKHMLADYLKNDRVIYHYVVKRTYYVVGGMFDASFRDNVIFYQDYSRLEIFKYLWEKWYDMLLPHGLGLWGAFKKGFGLNVPFRINTLDDGYFYMIYHYGVFVSFLLIGWLASKIRKRLLRASGFADVSFIVCAVLIFFVVFGINVPFQGVGVAVLIGGFWGIILNPGINYSMVFNRFPKRKWSTVFPRKRISQHNCLKSIS
jgi:hypothetical protein